MNAKEKNVEFFIVISAWVCYAIMVFTGKAESGGFIVLTTYIVKKFLDRIEKGDGKNEEINGNAGNPVNGSSQPGG